MKSRPEPLDAPRARNLALQWLARREHSSFEVQDKLVKKGCAPDIAAQVVERLKTERLLSDERFIESTIAARRRRGHGPLRVRHALGDKGISGESLERGLDPSEEEWVALAAQVRRKRFGAALPRTPAERAKQARFLQYRGFTYDQIQRVLNARDDD